MPRVYAKCKTEHVLPYVSADGYYWPCCWVPNHPHTAKIREFLGDRHQQLDVATYELEQIKHSEAMQILEDSWSDGSFAPCLRFCATPFDDTSRMTTDDKLMIHLERKRKEDHA